MSLGDCNSCLYQEVKMTDHPCCDCEVNQTPWETPWSQWILKQGEETMPPKKPTKKKKPKIDTSNVDVQKIVDDLLTLPPELEVLYHPVKSLAGTGKEYMKAQAKISSPTLLHIQIPCKMVNRNYGAAFDLAMNHKLWHWLKKLEHSLNSLSSESGSVPVKYFPIQIRHKRGRIVVQIAGKPLNREYGFRGKWGKTFIADSDVYRFIKENCS